MHQATAYLPGDRRRALLTGQSLPERANGAVLFVDISGFTPLTETLARQFGRSRGAELLTQTLNEVYQALIDQVDQHDGSVIGFAGDAITCWFDAAADDPVAAARRALNCAVAIQYAMTRFAHFEVAPGAVAALAVKAALASGSVRRLLVGDPAQQVIDVLAGAPLARMAAAEHVAVRGEIVADAATIDLLHGRNDVGVWRADESGQPVGVITRWPPGQQAANPVPAPLPTLPEALIRPWLLPAVWMHLQQNGEQYLAELRPAAALFVRFSGIDFEHDNAATHLDAYIRWVQQVLAQHDGALIQLTTGDKGSYLYAAFGAPIASEDYAEQALAAALTLRTSPAQFDFITAVQIGVSAGLMRVGAYGSSTRCTYGVLGDETNLAARLMMMAAPGQVLVSARAAPLVEANYLLSALGEREFKGKAGVQMVYAALGVRSPTLRQLAALYRTPPLGRDPEVAAINAALMQAQQGRGCLIRIEGEAGVGKSHLGAAAAQRATAHGFQLLYGVCQSTGQQPYAVLRAALTALFDLTPPPEASADAWIERVRAELTAIDPAWLVRLPLLGEVLGLPIPDNPTTASLDPRLRREAIGSLIVGLLHHFAARQPIFLLLEDIHWLDEADQVILLAICRALTERPLVICVLQRPVNGQEAPFWSQLAALPEQVHLPLTELTAPALAALVTQRLGGPVSPLVAELIYAQTQGNPFFAEELVDALCEQDAIVQEEGVWVAGRALLQALHAANALERSVEMWRLRAAAPLSPGILGLPETVHGLVLARLHRLSEEARLTLKVASVIGRTFELGVVAAAHPRALPAATLQQQLAELETRDFARLESPPPLTSYLFKHSITQEAVYQTLLESQRQELHLAVARALEMLAPDVIERLAHHYSQADLTDAGVRQRACAYLDAAAWRARRSYANETALTYFDRALALETRWTWLRGKVEVLHILGLRLQEEATLLALDGDPTADPAVVAELWAEFHEATSHFPAARRELEQALAHYAAAADPLNQARVLARMGEVVMREGDIDAAEQLYRQALTLLANAEEKRAVRVVPHGPPLAPPTIRAQVLLGLGVVLRQRGEYEAAAAMLTEALTLYTAQENQPGVATALTRLGGVAFLRRDFGAARAAWQQALTIRRMIGDREGEGSSLLNIAQAYTSLGDYGAALPLLRQALAIQRAIGNRWWENAVWNALGIVALAVGDYAEARRCIVQAEALCHAVGDEAGAAIMVFNLAQVERACGEYASALARLKQSHRWAQANDDPEFAAQCLTEAALTAQAAGELAEAEGFARAALEGYAALEMHAAMTTDLATLALVHLVRGEVATAQGYARRLLEIFESSEIHQLEYPQRDLYVASRVAAAGGEDAQASALLQRAYALVHTRAASISDAALRCSFLEKVAINREIVAAATSTPLGVG